MSTFPDGLYHYGGVPVGGDLTSLAMGNVYFVLESNPTPPMTTSLRLGKASITTTVLGDAKTKLELIENLIDVLGTDEIDLVVLNAQENVPLAAKVLRACKVIVDKAPFDRHKFESLTLRKYFDFQPRELNILKTKVMGHGG